MGIATGIMVYIIVWWLIWFMVLPIGVVTQEEAGEDIVPGTIKSAPKKPMLRMKAAGTTFVAALVWGVIYYLIDTA